MFCTYLHRRDDTNAVFYVGKGSLERAHSASGRNAWWRRVARKAGFTVTVLATWELESDALEHEVFLIRCFKDMSVSLCNVSEGGGGSPGYRHTPEARARIGAASSARPRSAETRAKMSKKMKGVHSGRVLAPEHRAKVLAALARGRATQAAR